VGALVEIGLNIGEIERLQDKPDEAMASVERALALGSELVAADPESIDRRISLAGAHRFQARLLATQADRLLEAISSYNEAIEIRESIVEKQPELAEQSYQLATDLRDLSSLQKQIGQSEPAAESLRRALPMGERAAQMYPDIPQYQQGLGSICNMISDLERQHGEMKTAYIFAQRGVATFENLVATYPNHDSYRRDLILTYHNLGCLLAQSGETAQALKSFQLAVDLTESLPRLDPQDNYHLACNTALCIPLIGVKKQPEVSPPGPTNTDKMRRKIYGDRAIEALRRSAMGTFATAEMLQNDTELDALRTRTDFQTLMKEVEEKPTKSGR
jgi:tetratricopeptide (TPR) repeat protein